MSFDSFNLHPLIVRNLSKLGYFSPRPIQAQAMGPVTDGKDIIGLAQTGTGKTAAFIAPIAHQLISDRPAASIGKLKDPMTRLRALVLCPTRELAQQVAAEAARIVQGTVLRTACAYGKVSIARQAAQISRGVDILIATPGRVRELLEHGGGGGGSSLSLAYVRHVAIDEADRMLDMGFLPQVTQILKAIPARRQMLLFTSTMPAEVEELARQFMRDPVRIEAEPHTTTAPHLQQHLLPVDEDDKVPMLIHLLSHPPRKGVLVFCRTKRRVGWVGTALQRNNISTGMLHGDRSQAQRQDALDKFTQGERRVLVATDVAARGLHIPAVKTVVNYDLSISPEEYVHRVGRAGHGGGFGESFTFLSNDDDEKRRWRNVMDTTGIEVYAETLEGFAPSKPARGRRRGVAHPSTAARGNESEEATYISRRQLKRQSRTQGRSRKSRPIKKGEKPGKGVRRIA